MAEIIVEKVKLDVADCKQMPTADYPKVRAMLGLAANEEVAFALVVIDRPDNPNYPGVPNHKYCLLTSPTRTAVHPNWHHPGQKHFPANTQVEPGPNEVLVITYPGDEYKGFCTVIGGKTVWF